MALSRCGWLCLLLGLGLYLSLPLGVVVLYGLATRWTNQPLPDGYTLQHWQTALMDPRLRQSILRSGLLAAGVTLLDWLLVLPAVYWQWIRNPRIRLPIELAATVAFALPYVVIAFGILSATGMLMPQWQGTVGLLALGHGAISFPFLYWAVDGAMAAANVALLNEAAQTCGASPGAILRWIVLPNIQTGLVTGSLLAFATSFSEFALVQILVGNRFETMTLYSFDLLTGTNADFHQLAVLTCLMFGLVFGLSVVAVLGNWRQAAGFLAPVPRRNRPS